MEEKLFFPHPLGTKLCGILNDADKDTNSSIIILVHGFTSNKNTSSFTRIIENLTKAGIATFRIDLYGHGESEGDFADITITKGKDSVLATVEFLKTKDYSKIGLLGSSFGGISGLMAASQTQDLFCLGLKSPVSDWMKNTYMQTPGLLEKWEKDGFIYYDSEESKPRLNYSLVEDVAKNNPYEEASKITIPTLVVHGDADEVVPYETSVKLVSLMPSAKLHIVKGANHVYSSDLKHFEEMTEVFSEFFIEESKKI